jgi:hypothetical protein
VRANEDDQQQIESGTAVGGTAASTAPQLAGREPYTPPVIEKFPPMGNVTFGTSVQPMLAMSLSGA